MPFDVDHPVATCRTANEPYNEETTFRVTVDGFLVSDNVEAVSADVVDAGVSLLRPQSYLYGLHFEGGIKRQK